METHTNSIGIKQIQKVHWRAQDCHEQMDVVAVEEPLEMQVAYGDLARRKTQPLSITMRTPGADEDLVAGFLFTEGIIRSSSDLIALKAASDSLSTEQGNVMLAVLSPKLDFDPARLSRNFYTTSSCGVCGKTSLDLVAAASCYRPAKDQPVVAVDVLCGLPDKLAGVQSIFEQTGGIHAAGLFDRYGELILMREDVGRHNALDKLIGAALRAGRLPLNEHILLLSGRISFELVQKAAMAGIPIIAAVGAPSSLAVELATERGISLAGFVRANRMNVYSGQNRVVCTKNIADEA